MTVAYGLMRFSGKKQEKGDSTRRQTDWHEEMRRKYGYELRPLEVRGVSAFKGKHLRMGDLARFVERVAAGQIEPGCVLLVERIDRLTREDLDEAMELWRKILRAGVNIRTKSPDKLYTRESLKDIIGILEPLMEMQRAHQESVAKSERVAAAKARKRHEAKHGGRFSRRCPFWLRWDDAHNRWAVIPDRAEAVRRVFAMAVAGHSLREIARAMNADEVPTARGSAWQTATVGRLLNERAALGEFRSRQMAEPIRNYYPAVVDAESWYRAQGGLKHRWRYGGRPGSGVPCLLTGLTFDHATGERLVHVGSHVRGVSRPYLSPASVKGGERCNGRGCRYDVVEEVTLAMLAELETQETGAVVDDGAEEALAEVLRRIEEVKRRAADPETKDPLVYFDLLEELQAQRRAAQEKVAAQRANSARAAGKSRMVMDYLARKSAMSPEENASARKALKARLAEVVERVWVRVERLTHVMRNVTVTVQLIDGRRKVATVQTGRRPRTAAAG